MIWKKLSLVVISLFLTDCASIKKSLSSLAPASGYRHFTFEPLPEWTDKYSQLNRGNRSFFQISKLMESFKISRLQAIELQNHFRDLTVEGLSPEKAFRKALNLVRTENFESRLSHEKLSKAPFIVVVDVDSTLLDQYYGLWKRGKAYYDYIIDFENGKRAVSLAPGWQVLFKKIKTLGGLIVIFSANLDETVLKMSETVTIENQKLAEYVDGIMTNNYLVLQGKHEWTKEVLKSHPLCIPSKDLRFLDESLEKVIIIDDNPDRIVQRNRLRLSKKYHADLYFKNRLAMQAYQSQLLKIANEIEESFQYAKRHNISFARAYLPYTETGQIALKWLTETDTLTPEKAFQTIRGNAVPVDTHF